MIPIELKTFEQIKYWNINLIESLGISAKFYCRSGGVSQDEYTSFNHGYGLGDNPELVTHNRLSAYKVGQFGPFQPVLVKQVHSATIMEVDHKQSGQGWLNESEHIPEADGLITMTPGLPLAVKTADCLPVMISSTSGQAIAIIHAGWRGLVNGIIAVTVEKLRTCLSIEQQQFIVVLGPCISQNHFSVTKELFNQFEPFGPEAFKIIDNIGYVNMQAIARQQLMKLGLNNNNIYQVPGCTFSDSNDYFSYRRDKGNTGRMLSMIQINPQ